MAPQALASAPVLFARATTIEVPTTCVVLVAAVLAETPTSGSSPAAAGQQPFREHAHKGRASNSTAAGAS